MGRLAACARGGGAHAPPGGASEAQRRPQRRSGAGACGARAPLARSRASRAVCRHPVHRASSTRTRIRAPHTPRRSRRRSRQQAPAARSRAAPRTRRDGAARRKAPRQRSGVPGPARAGCHASRRRRLAAPGRGCVPGRGGGVWPAQTCRISHAPPLLPHGPRQDLVAALPPAAHAALLHAALRAAAGALTRGARCVHARSSERVAPAKQPAAALTA